MGTESNSNMIETRCVDPYSTAREEREREAEKSEERSGSVRISVDVLMGRKGGRQTKEAEEETAKSPCMVQPDLS